jgi:hypothetical protein
MMSGKLDETAVVFMRSYSAYPTMRRRSKWWWENLSFEKKNSREGYISECDVAGV